MMISEVRNCYALTLTICTEISKQQSCSSTLKEVIFLFFTFSAINMNINILCPPELFPVKRYVQRVEQIFEPITNHFKL